MIKEFRGVDRVGSFITSCGNAIATVAQSSAFPHAVDQMVRRANKFDKALGALKAIAEEARDLISDVPEVAGILHCASESVAELETVEEQ
jgi:hypothetical protein